MDAGAAHNYAESSFSASKIWLQPLGGGDHQAVNRIVRRIGSSGLIGRRTGKQLACVRGLWAMDAVFD